MANIIFRVSDGQKKAYGESALSEGKSLSNWLKDMADERSGIGVKNQIFTKPSVDAFIAPIEKKLGKVKKQVLPTIYSAVTEYPVKPKPSPPVGRIYTGAMKEFNGVPQYEYETENGMRWTAVPPGEE